MIGILIVYFDGNLIENEIISSWIDLLNLIICMFVKIHYFHFKICQFHFKILVSTVEL